MTSTSRRTFCLQSLAAGLSAVTLLSGCAVTPQNARVWRGRFSLRITAADGRLENQTGLLTELLGFTLPVVPLANLLAQTAAAEMSVYGPWRAQILSRFTDGSPQRLRIDGRAGQTSAAPLVQLTIFVEA